VHSWALGRLRYHIIILRVGSLWNSFPINGIIFLVAADLRPIRQSRPPHPAGHRPRGGIVAGARVTLMRRGRGRTCYRTHPGDRVTVQGRGEGAGALFATSALFERRGDRGASNVWRRQTTPWHPGASPGTRTRKAGRGLAGKCVDRARKTLQLNARTWYKRTMVFPRGLLHNAILCRRSATKAPGPPTFRKGAKEELSISVTREPRAKAGMSPGKQSTVTRISLRVTRQVLETQ
jgi:hypothetical protein